MKTIIAISSQLNFGDNLIQFFDKLNVETNKIICKQNDQTNICLLDKHRHDKMYNDIIKFVIIYQNDLVVFKLFSTHNLNIILNVNTEKELNDQINYCNQILKEYDLSIDNFQIIQINRSFQFVPKENFDENKINKIINKNKLILDQKFDCIFEIPFENNVTGNILMKNSEKKISIRIFPDNNTLNILIVCKNFEILEEITKLIPFLLR